MCHPFQEFIECANRPRKQAEVIENVGDIGVGNRAELVKQIEAINAIRRGAWGD